MKVFFAIILSILVFTETVFPCCIWDGCEQEEVAMDHSGESKSPRECSPFATCSACAPAIALQTPVIELQVAPEMPLAHTPQPQHFILSSYNKAILQPPRLV